MTGLKTTTMTTEDMRVARKRGESKSDLALLRQNKLAGIEPEDDEDSPEASKLIREAIAKHRVGRPVGQGNKQQIAIRLDKEVLNAFRTSGSGWQTRINDALKSWLKEHTPEANP